MTKKSGRNYRGYRYPIPIDGYPLIDVCFQIPDHMYYRAAVRGQLRTLTQFYAWHNENNQDLEQRWGVARQFQNSIFDTLVFGDCMTEQLQVRTSPDDACILEYSPDGGLNWFPYADMTNCQDIAGDSFQLNVSLNLSQQSINNLKYDGSTTSINVNAPTVIWDTGGTDDRKNALCMACMSLVDTISAMEVQALTDRYAGFALILAGLMILMPGFIAFGVIIAGALIGGYGYEVAVAALQDRDAKLAVACCMFDYLQGKAVTLAELSVSLDACGFVGGSNEAIVRDYVDASIQHETTYLAMLDIAGRAFVQTSVLGINLCECGDCGICTFDDPVNDLPYSLIFGTLGINGNPANCLHAVEWTSGGFPHGRRVEARFDLPAVSTINKVSWNFYHVNTGFPGGALAESVSFFDSGDNFLAQWAASPVTPKGSWETASFSGSQANVAYAIIYMAFVCNCPGTREIRMDNVRFFCA